jgi:thymidylate kinase
LVPDAADTAEVVGVNGGADEWRPGLTATRVNGTDLTRYDLVVLEGCDGTGKTTLAGDLAARHGYTVVHSGPADGQVDLVARYRATLSMPGKVALDRSFVSELVYGPLRYGRSLLSPDAAAELAFDVADAGGVLVHLTGNPDKIAKRLRARDGYAPSPERIRALVDGYRNVFAVLSDAAPVITVDVLSGG